MSWYEILLADDLLKLADRYSVSRKYILSRLYSGFVRLYEKDLMI